MEVVKKESKGKGATHTERLTFPVSKEQREFVKAHKDVNWAATMRKALDEVIGQIQKTEKPKK